MNAYKSWAETSLEELRRIEERKSPNYRRLIQFKRKRERERRYQESSERIKTTLVSWSSTCSLTIALVFDKSNGAGLITDAMRCTHTKNNTFFIPLFFFWGQTLFYSISCLFNCYIYICTKTENFLSSFWEYPSYMQIR